MKYYQPVDQPGDANASYSNGNLGAGIKGSIPDARAIEHPQREILAVIAAAGLTPDEETLTQLRDAIAIIAGNRLRAQGTNIASAATTNIGAADSDFITVTGTTTITSLGTGTKYDHVWVKFAGVLTLTHNATSLILPTGANIVTVAGDMAEFVRISAGNWQCVGYHRATGSPLGSSPTERKQLTANTTFYVTTTGNDSTGDGSVGAPWLTVQKAIDVLTSKYDGGGYNATINVGSGTFAGASITNPFIGGGIIVNGNGAANTTIGVIYASSICSIQVQNYKASNLSGPALQADQGGRIVVGAGMNFGACSGEHMLASNGGKIIRTAAYTISGNASYHLRAGSGSFITESAAILVTVSTAIVVTAFALSTGSSMLDTPATSFTGSAVTGSRHSVTSNAVINVNGAGTTFFPGSTAGSTATGGQYT